MFGRDAAVTLTKVKPSEVLDMQRTIFIILSLNLKIVQQCNNYHENVVICSIKKGPSHFGI